MGFLLAVQMLSPGPSFRIDGISGGTIITVWRWSSRNRYRNRLRDRASVYFDYDFDPDSDFDLGMIDMLD
jgi:hypothetical protein